jgi:uncharacterized protein YkwD
LYNYSADGKNVKEVAQNIAEYSLNQWIQSPGHHENLLSGSHSMHGAAFRIDEDGIVWGTDLFAYCSTSPSDGLMAYAPQSPSGSVNVQATVVAQCGKEKQATVAIKPKKINITKEANQLCITLYKADHLKRNKAMENAALKHAEYLTYAKNASSEQDPRISRFYAKTPFGRVVKASGGLFLFTSGSGRLKEQLAVLEVEMDTFSADDILQRVYEKLGVTPEQSRKVGIGVFMKRKKNTLRVAVVRLYC